ncbi:MAG: ribonuclease HII [Candidatus Zixiibacteriota bacterium]
MSRDTKRIEMLKNIKIDEFLDRSGYKTVTGVDEAGRGPLAGPVVAAAVILPDDVTIDGLDDSKKLSAAQREELFEEIAEREIPVSVGIIDNRTIDQMNILRASLMAMRRSVCGLKPKPECCLVDGSFEIPNLEIAQMAIVDGDAIHPAIAAASIVAKVTRDRIMRQYDEIYPQYSFAEHFGYPTPKHLKELKKHGPTSIHRRSFKPVADALEEVGVCATGKLVLARPTMASK